MLKPVYGLKDAPRAWRKNLHEVLVGWMSCRQLCSEPELYCVHRSDEKIGDNLIERARQHNAEQQEVGFRKVIAQEYKNWNFQRLLSVHVDDIRAWHGRVSGRVLVLLCLLFCWSVSVSF